VRNDNSTFANLPSKDHHIGPLDGVRGVAILLVLFNHFTPDLLMPDRIQEWAKKLLSTGGWAGVDLFFVLSGFLITGILLRTKSEPDYFLNFYARRLLRIFPLYYATLFMVFIALPALGVIHGSWFEPIREAQAFHWLYGTNVAFWLLPKEAVFSEHHLDLRHFWSLAVEEHFYLFWPAIVYAMKLTSLKRVCIILIASAFAFRFLGLYLHEPAGFFTLTFCKWDALAAGALIALSVHEDASAVKRLRIPASATTLLGATYLAILFFINKGLWPNAPGMPTIGVSVVAATFAGLVVLAINPASVVARSLDIAPLRFAGKYSYGVYVIHGVIGLWLAELIPTEQWVTSFGQSFPSIVVLAFTKITVSFLCAIVSWHIFEVRFLKLKRYFGGPTSIVAQLPNSLRSDPKSLDSATRI
jgi:peptidoglycan/LPS O-acetylase OafA/YrhL